jgi:membrane protein implicated in regulation of membrane protease activity
MEAKPAGGELMLLVVALVLFLLLPDPWNSVLGLVFAVLGLGELFLWNRTVRGRRKVVGTQTLVGKTAEVRVACRPHGQVFVDGELWEADCVAGADVGARVRIRGVNGLTLVVEPAP